MILLRVTSYSEVRLRACLYDVEVASPGVQIRAKSPMEARGLCSSRISRRPDTKGASNKRAASSRKPVDLVSNGMAMQRNTKVTA